MHAIENWSGEETEVMRTFLHFHKKLPTLYVIYFTFLLNISYMVLLGTIYKSLNEWKNCDGSKSWISDSSKSRISDGSKSQISDILTTSEFITSDFYIQKLRSVLRIPH